MASPDPVIVSAESTKSIQQTVQELAKNIIATTESDRKDRLWPCDPMAFQTNPLNLAFGACGTALFLHDALGRIPPDALNWLTRQSVDVETYPPGLYTGIAGIAWTFAEIGMPDRSADLLDLIPQSPLRFVGPDLYSGAAGWGLAALSLYLRTDETRFLDMCCVAGEYLLSTAEKNHEGTFWRERESGAIPLGIALGASGIALFLLYMWRVTRETRYLQVACDAMNFEVAQAQEAGSGGLAWASTADGLGHRPYWFRGGAGVLAALVRFYQLLKEERYLDLARKAALPVMGFFSAAPHLFEGLASMGESCLDMYMVTGETAFFDAAMKKGRQTLLYSIERPDGLAFPGRSLIRISHDYGMGGAGIGSFLYRLAALRPRRFHDIFPNESLSSRDGHKNALETQSA